MICAPTGSGKTVMFELAITRLLMEAPLPWLNIKVVYSKYYAALNILVTEQKMQRSLGMQRSGASPEIILRLNTLRYCNLLHSLKSWFSVYLWYHCNDF